MGKRERTADIANVGAMIFGRGGAATAAPNVDAHAPSVTAPNGAAAGTPSAAPRRPSHPAEAERTERRTRRDVFDVDPKRIVERGPYIREWDAEGEEFERLLQAVRARGEIDTPLWVRSSGPAGNRTLVLVSGKGRLHAALRAGLATVPVRDWGELDDRQAVGRQLEENLNRQDMSPAETALALWLVHGFGESISDIGRRLHRDKGYVSYMVRVGEAIDACTREEQVRLARRGVLQVRQCQAIGALPDVAARIAALREVLSESGDGEQAREDDSKQGREAAAASEASRSRRKPPSKRPREEGSQFEARPLRDGRTFRMKWVNRDLQVDPGAVAQSFVDAVAQESAALAEALRRLEREGRGERVRVAAAAARRVLESTGWDGVETMGQVDRSSER